ncbi:MAG TPA: divalent metal cation transporter [Candidatus Limnocylindrales bacterium]|nr:divalent metal cation transporter [Candidatus Limnocylindrales bacterium]
MNKVLSLALGIVTATGGFLDAGAISTAAAAGANFGFGLIWAMVLGTIAVILLVEMSGRLTAMSGKTYADGIRERFGFKFYLFPLTSEIIANSLLLAADLGGMALGLSLLTGISWHVLLPVAAIIVFVMIWRAPFGVIENGPSLLGLTALATVGGVIALGPPPKDLVPTLWNPVIGNGEVAEYLFIAAAILGAVVSPYLLYFYSSGAGEERWSRRSLGLNRATAVLGMGFGSLTAISLIVLSAQVLAPLDIAGGTLPEIGLALVKPFGTVGSILFPVILFAACLGAALEVVLSLAYNVAQGFGWEWGEEKKPAEAARFNLVMVVFLIFALGLSLIGMDPLQLALFGSAFTALVLPISLLPFLVLMNDRDYLHDRVNGALGNVALGGILLIAFVVAVVSIPLLILSGG